MKMSYTMKYGEGAQRLIAAEGDSLIARIEEELGEKFDVVNPLKGRSRKTGTYSNGDFNYKVFLKQGEDRFYLKVKYDDDSNACWDGFTDVAGTVMDLVEN